MDAVLDAFEVEDDFELIEAQVVVDYLRERDLQQDEE